MRNDVIEPESKTVLGPNSAIRIGAVGVIGAFVWWAATLTADVNTIKSQLVKFNSIDLLSSKIETLTSRVEQMEKRGSEPVQILQKTMDKIATDLQLHIETDKVRKKE